MGDGKKGNPQSKKTPANIVASLGSSNFSSPSTGPGNLQASNSVGGKQSK